MLTSPLTQGRELKWLRHNKKHRNLLSPLTQGRELKLTIGTSLIWLLESPLTQGRELKFMCVRYDHSYSQVAPHAGA